MKLFRWRGRSEPDMTGALLAPIAALYTAGRFAEAEAEARSVAAGPFRPRDEGYGPLALRIAALAAEAQGHHDRAAAAYGELLPVFGRTFGAEHPHSLHLRSNRARVLSILGRHGECVAECVDVAQLANRSTGPDMLYVAAAARSEQVYALTELGRHTEAEALARQALAGYREPDRLRLVLRLSLAHSLSGQGRYVEALAEVERADVLRRSLSREDPHVAIGSVELVAAAALLGLGRGAEAQLRAVAAYDACMTALGPDHFRTGKARELLDRIDGD
ncbi:tetratricopeptide repeat protein [Streptomyces sp. NPDC002886]|uniref:tetratricopeptide repeat protein n=1 Tax=Streptomyces sp. NPDC002886 TaxID=3364667 RepID=UPI0036788ACD